MNMKYKSVRHLDTYDRLNADAHLHEITLNEKLQLKRH